jgi:hypothetical protein
MTFFLAAGIGLIVFGVTLTDRGAGTDPAKQFTKHVDGCQVVSYTTEARDKKATNKDRSNRCQDFYNYTAIFKSGAPSSEPFSTGWASAGYRKTTELCADNDDAPVTPDFAIDETTTCWSPASTLSDDDHELYRCANVWGNLGPGPCYKLFDPAQYASGAIVGGIALIVFGALFSCCSLTFCFLASKTDGGMNV